MGIEGAVAKVVTGTVVTEGAHVAAELGAAVALKGGAGHAVTRAVGKGGAMEVGVDGASEFVNGGAVRVSAAAANPIPELVPAAVPGAGLRRAAPARSALPTPTPDNPMNLVNVTNPQEVAGSIQQLMGGRRAIGLAGYSAPPAAAMDTYNDLISAYVRGRVGPNQNNFGILASPTADAGSIDAAGTIIAQQAGMPIGYTTSRDFVGYINPKNFPPGVNHDAYAAAPKFVFPDNAAYSAGQAAAAGEQVIAGGRQQALADFVNTVNQGKPVTLLDSSTFSTAWDPIKNRIDNTSRFVQETLEHLRRGTTPEDGFRWIPEVGFTEGFARNLLARESRGEHPFLYVNVSSPADAFNAGQAASRVFDDVARGAGAVTERMEFGLGDDINTAVGRLQARANETNLRVTGEFNNHTLVANPGDSIATIRRPFDDAMQAATARHQQRVLIAEEARQARIARGGTTDRPPAGMTLDSRGVLPPGSFFNRTDRPLALLTPRQLAELPEGTIVTSISGERLIMGLDRFSDDTRGGFTAYGFSQ